MKKINAIGKPCPMPVVMTKKEIESGEGVLEVTVDNRTAVENLTRLAGNAGYTVSTHPEGELFVVTLALQGEAPVPAAQEQTAPVSATQDYAVFVSRAGIGEGDPALGASLMTMFFYTLAQSGKLPRAICFMNGGARLPVENEQIADHLRDMTAQGVEVLVCGTCLKAFGLEQRLSVGTVSNMYDILERLQAAAKVITL